jgi:hypothetical protein
MHEAGLRGASAHGVHTCATPHDFALVGPRRSFARHAPQSVIPVQMAAVDRLKTSAHKAADKMRRVGRLNSIERIAYPTTSKVPFACVNFFAVVHCSLLLSQRTEDR